MRSIFILAVLVFTVCTASEMIRPCCVTTSRTEVDVPIKGYKLQEKKLPCVRAVIFETEKGQLCIDPNQKWVRGKIEEFINSKKKNSS